MKILRGTRVLLKKAICSGWLLEKGYYIRRCRQAKELKRVSSCGSTSLLSTKCKKWLEIWLILKPNYQFDLHHLSPYNPHRIKELLIIICVLSCWFGVILMHWLESSVFCIISWTVTTCKIEIFIVNIDSIILLFLCNCRIEPKYQELQGKDVAKVAKDGIEVRVIAGESMGIQSPVYTRTPTMYLDFTLKPKAHLQQPIPPTWNSFVYIIEGEGIFGNAKSSPATAHHLLLLGSGDGLQVWNNSSSSLRFIVVGGKPIGEPVVQFGPFVMNTQEEIDQTIEDYEYCNNGFEKAKQWKSQALSGHDF